MTLWKEKYQTIKDPSWPSCDNFVDFDQLPEYIKSECIEVHNFSPDIWKQNIVDDAVKSFTIDTPAHVAAIVDHITHMIAEQKVIDFACNTGVYSFACWRAGAQSVFGFDVRESNITMARAIQVYLGVDEKKLQFEIADVHDYLQVSQMCQDKDTALIPGVLYHVHDQYQILSAVAKSKVKNIVIETGENQSIMNNNEPLIWWRVEPTFENVSGWHNGDCVVPVGYPNLAWFNLITEKLGYRLVSTRQHTISHSKNNAKEFEQTRSVHVYTMI